MAQRQFLLSTTVILAIGAGLLGGAPLPADVIKTDQESIEGAVELTMLALATASGTVEIPRYSVRRITANGDSSLEVELVDGTRLAGRPSFDELRVQTGMLVRVVPRDQVRSVLFGPVGLDERSLLTGYYRVNEYKANATIRGCPLRFEVDAGPYLLRKTALIQNTRFFTCAGMSVASARNRHRANRRLRRLHVLDREQGSTTHVRFTEDSIHMSELIVLEPGPGGLAEDKDLARSIRQNQILPAIESGERVVLDFSSIPYATQSFVHALFAEVLQKHGEKALDQLEFRGCSEAMRSLIELVVDYTLGGFPERAAS